MNIPKRIKKAQEKIDGIKLKLEKAEFEFDQIQKQCPHINVKTWTNDDGDGQFNVHKCLDCGLQKDHSLQ